MKSWIKAVDAMRRWSIHRDVELIAIGMVVVIGLLVVGRVRDEWRTRHAHCTTMNLAADFGSAEAAEAWAKTVREAEAYCPPGQWDRSRVDWSKE